MRIILMRHAPAEDRDPQRWPDDRARPLTERGMRRARQAARGVCALEREVARIWTSPAARAQATADAFAAESRGDAIPEPFEVLAPEAAPKEAVALVRSLKGEGVVLVVGHEPGLSAIAGALLGAPANSLGLKKCGACALDLDPTGARLGWWMTPRALRAVAHGRSRT